MISLLELKDAINFLETHVSDEIIVEEPLTKEMRQLKAEIVKRQRRVRGVLSERLLQDRKLFKKNLCEEYERTSLLEYYAKEILKEEEAIRKLVERIQIMKAFSWIERETDPANFDDYEYQVVLVKETGAIELCPCVPTAILWKDLCRAVNEIKDIPKTEGIFEAKYNTHKFIVYIK